MPAMTATMETTLPGIGQYKSQIPVKVTNMQLMSGPFHDRSLGAMLHLNDEFIQQEQQRGWYLSTQTKLGPGVGKITYYDSAVMH